MSDTMLFGSIVLVGAFASGIMQLLKAKFTDMSGWKAKLSLIAICIVLGGLYQLFKAIGWLETAIAILMTSSTVYALFIKSSSKSK